MNIGGSSVAQILRAHELHQHIQPALVVTQVRGTGEGPCPGWLGQESCLQGEPSVEQSFRRELMSQWAVLSWMDAWSFLLVNLKGRRE